MINLLNFTVRKIVHLDIFNPENSYSILMAKEKRYDASPQHT